MELLPKPVPDAFVNYLNLLNETDYLISIATTDTQPTTTEAPLNENDLRNEVEQLIDELYLKFVRVNNISMVEQHNWQITINHLRANIRSIIDSFIRKMEKLDTECSDLKREMNSLQNKVIALENKQNEIKRTKIVAEIFAPLKKNIMREMTSNQIPIAYYDGNIFKSLYSSSTNDIKSSEYYIDVFRITNEFQEEHHRAFQNLIEKWANDFNVAYPVLLELLFEKQRRNFEQHALLTDFIKDSLPMIQDSPRYFVNKIYWISLNSTSCM